MASQEGIELSRLRIHRFPDHYTARAGATSRLVSQISMADSASESAEAELSQHPPSIVPSSDGTTHNTSDTVFSSNAKSPLIFPRNIEPSEAEDVRTTIRYRKTSTPWTLRRLSLLGLIVFITALIVALEALHFYSKQNQGLVTADQDATYLWKYLPTAILTTLAFYWNKLDYHTKALMPWKLMSEKPQAPDQSLLLDYVSNNPLVVLSGAIRRLHVPVIASAIGSLTIVLVTVFSTGLFVLQPTLLNQSTKVTVSSTFDGTVLNASLVDSFPVLAASSILSGNLSIDYPPSTNMNYAVDTFSVPANLSGLHASKSGYVEAFYADLNCKIGLVNSYLATLDEYGWTIEADLMDDGCSTGLTHVARPSRGYDLVPVGKVIFQQCPGHSEPKIFILFGQMDVNTPYNMSLAQQKIYPFNSTVLACTPSHKFQAALVTTDPGGALLDVAVQETLDKDLVSPWDLWSAFNMSLQAASPTFLTGPNVGSHDNSMNIYSYDSFFAALLASWSREPADYLDSDTLMRDSRQFYTTTAGQIADRLLRRDLKTVALGSYQTTRLRVIIRTTALRITEAGLAMLIVCTCLIVVLSPCSSVSSAGTTLTSLAVTINKSDQLKSLLRQGGEMSLDQIKGCVSEQLFSLEGHGTRKSISAQLHAPDAIVPSDMTPSAGVDAWWRPVALSVYMKITVLALPLAIVACLEVTYQVSRKGNGLADASSSQYWHYAWTWIPATTMTLVSLLYSSVTWSVALMDPYSILRTKSVAAQHALHRVNLSRPSIQLGYQGLRLKRYALLAGSVAALVAPLLTIIVSGLILVQPIRQIEGLIIPLIDQILSPKGKILNMTGWTQASLSAANLLSQGYGSYPKGTYENFVFPNLEQYTIPPTGVKLLNASTVDVDAGVIMSNITCRVMDPAGFRYTVGVNGSNDPAEMTPQFGWHAGKPADHYLNFTHVDFAVYGCKEAGFYCDEDIGIGSVGIVLGANSTRFSSQYQVTLRVLEWAAISAWPDGDTLGPAVASRNKTTHVFPYNYFFYGTWNATSAHITGLACYDDIRQGRANITYDLSTHTVRAVKLIKGKPVVLSGENYPWSTSDGLAVLLPNGNLWQTVLNNTPEAFYDTPTGSARLATQISDLYNHFFTQYYSNALRDKNLTADTAHANAILTDNNRQRVVQSAISTRILQALLLAMWLCACIVYWLFDVKTLLPKNPCSIAAQASLLADSKFLDMIPEGAENATLEELMQMTPFKDHLFSMGWWDDGMGGRRFGIDVGMADFDKGEDDEGKVEERAESGNGVVNVEDGMAGKADVRISVDIVGSRL